MSTLLGGQKSLVIEKLLKVAAAPFMGTRDKRAYKRSDQRILA